MFARANYSQEVKLICQSLSTGMLDDDALTELKKRLIHPKLDWKKCFDFASQHWLLAQWFASLANSNLLPLIPEKPRAELEIAHQLTVNRNKRLKSQLIDVVSALNQDNIQPLLLKGASYFIDPFDSRLEARMTSDLDILVRESEIEKAVQALKSDGYVFMDFHPNGIYYHLDPLIKEGEPARVELHRHPLSEAGCEVLNSELIWSQAIKHNDLGLEYFLLPENLRVVHLVAHAQIHDRDYANNRIDLRQLYDFVLMHNSWRNQLDHQFIKSLFSKANATNYWENYCLYAKILFPSFPVFEVKTTLGSRLFAYEIISLMQYHRSKELFFHWAQRLLRLPRRLLSPSWYKLKFHTWLTGT